MKICLKCKKEQNIKNFGRNKNRKDGLSAYCRICKSEKDKDYRTKNRERLIQFDRDRISTHHYLKKYGITLEQKKIMWEKQKRKCAICFDNMPFNNNCHVDHNHKTGKVRGLLCNHCNQGIGQLGGDIKGIMKAIDYLKKYE